MGKTAFLIVDVQCALVEGHPYNEVHIIENICKVIETARQNGVEVIYVQHDGGIGDELERNTKGWEIYQAVAPMPNEKIFEKKFNSAFKETKLREYMDEQGIKTIILSGMQTEYCIDTTCKTAFEYGFCIIIPQNTTTTYDNDMFSGKAMIKYYEQKIWSKRFAQVMPFDEVTKNISEGYYT